MRKLYKLYIIICAYCLYSCFHIYKLYSLPKCTETEACTRPAYTEGEFISLKLCIQKDCFYQKNGTSLADLAVPGEDIEIPIARETRKNGTAVMEVKLESPDFPVATFKVRLTTYRLQRAPPATMLLQNKNYDELSFEEKFYWNAYEQKRKITHWRKRVSLRIAEVRDGIPDTQFPFKVTGKKKDLETFYPPPLAVDDQYLATNDFAVLARNISKGNPTTQLEITIQSLQGFLMYTIMGEQFKIMEKKGFSKEMFDEVKRLFGRGRFFQIVAEYIITILHVILSSLAFKNEIGFWRGTDNSKGLSATSVILRWIMQLIILLHLMNHPNITQVVIYMNGFSLLIEGWKVTKVLKAGIRIQGWKIIIAMGKKDKDEELTAQYDRECFKYLGAILFPVLLAYSVYDLMNNPQTSWWTWFIATLAYSVYVAGFICMIPQLYINYKLKTVAHMPMRAMVYKTFNTFVDDIFAFFIVDTPLSYRIATFRDDFVFFVFLFQMWKYPSDMKRANEYGYSYESLEKKIMAEAKEEIEKHKCKNQSEEERQKTLESLRKKKEILEAIQKKKNEKAKENRIERPPVAGKESEDEEEDNEEEDYVVVKDEKKKSEPTNLRQRVMDNLEEEMD